MMTSNPPPEGSWRLAPGVDATYIPASLKAALGLDDLSGLSAHHIVGSDGATLDPRSTHVTIARAQMKCGACNGIFRVPPLDLAMHGAKDASSSAYLECPYCRAAIRVTAVDDPSLPPPTAHWITTAQLTKAGSEGGTGRPMLDAEEIVVTDGRRVEVTRAPEVTAPASHARSSWLLTAIGIGACVLAGIVISIVAGAREAMSLWVVGAVLLVLGGVGASILAARRSTRRFVTPLTIAALLALSAAVLLPAWSAVTRCHSLSAGSNLSACDLSAADLSRRDLTGADLSAAILTDADLTGVQLSRASLRDARLRGADLTGAELGSVDLAGMDLTDVTLTEIEAAGVSFSGSNMTGLDLTGADLTTADLSSSDLGSSDLTGAILEGANLSGADLTSSDLSNANLGEVVGEGLIADGARLVDTDLAEADLSGSDLQDADLSGADLSSTDLSSADLKGADLTETDLSDADLTSADLRKADLSGADLSGTRLSSTDLREVTGVTDAMLVASLGVPRSQLVTAVVRNDLRFESPAAISRAVSRATKGQGVAGTRAYRPTGDFHPIVAASGSPELAAWLSQRDGVWTAPGLRFTQLVARESTGKQAIETCQYNIHPITRYRSTLHVSVFATKTGRLVAERTFLGPPARACQFTESVSIYELHGDAVSRNMVVDWLRGIVNPLRGVAQ